VLAADRFTQTAGVIQDRDRIGPGVGHAGMVAERGIQAGAERRIHFSLIAAPAAMSYM
jgi:hypothetical protein